ncbi:ABC transporter substrate-binding protein [Paenibacillus eucommiae]|uniref:Multiple sugar transport system substrate-binding protein n=1 Tax=Paenibacillus eucommiae TaxID=1355755 RepID=A0ABS4IXU4_9BACL|nr:extracellular solute-binding protein [Paenibacillus eucommiae]MBP1992407.1 multiple sugar transport system substrate-binding protein [Paenibacillus eucommiae]
MNRIVKMTCLMLAIILLSFITACGGGSKAGNSTSTPNNGSTGQPEASPSQKKITLKLYTLDETDKELVDSTIDEWHQINPNVDVETVILTGEDSMDKLKVMLAGGEKIDMVYYDFSNSSRDKASKIYYKLNDLMAEDNFDYLQTYGDYGRATMIGDDIYGFANWLSPSAVWVNTKMLEAKNIPLPDDSTWTFQDYFDMIAKLSTKEGGKQQYGGMHYQRGIAGILDVAAYGDWEIVKEDGSPNIDAPALKQAAQWFYDAMYTQKSMPTEADVDANKLVALFDYAKGELPTMLGAANSALFFDVWKTMGYLTEEVDAQNPFKLLKMPHWSSGGGTNKHTATVISHAVAKTSAHPKEAYQYLKFFTQQGLVLSSKTVHRIPVWKDADANTLMNNWKFYKDKDGNQVEGKDRTDLYKEALDRNQTPILPKYANEYAYSSLMLQELKKELSLVLANEKTIDKALADAQKASMDIYKKNSK